MNRKFIGCLLGAYITYLMSPQQDELRWGLTIFVLTGFLWITQAIPMSVTALMVPALAAITGLLPFTRALSSFANPIIFLFLGGFALAAALKEQGLDKALAIFVLKLSKGYVFRSVFFCLQQQLFFRCGLAIPPPPQ